ncbi:MAG TPA: hypothetical protein VKR06_36880 [Ktedonosporobacter sp.]|nr:hypothetical protein [Ktedonosporobacter sp.]
MLDIDTLNALHDLMADTLYAAEVARLPRLSRQEQEVLIVRARQGDSEAREALIVDCLHHVLGKARMIYNERYLDHDDLLDLIQVASLEMVAQFDRALSKGGPAAYLRGIARSAILQYCTYHSGMIQKPHYSLAALAKMDPHPATVESLDRPLYRDSKRIRVELIEMPPQLPVPDEKYQRRRFAPLYQGVKKLSRRQQSTLIQLYGLYGQPRKAPDDIGYGPNVRSMAYEAQKNLRIYLEHYLKQMITPEQTEE